MAAVPELCFGDFSKEEFDNYLTGQSCVELPPLYGEGDDYDFLNGDSSETTLCFFNGPILRDDNGNLIIDQLTESRIKQLDIIQPSKTISDDNLRVPNGTATSEELSQQPHNGQVNGLASEERESEVSDIPQTVLVNGHSSDSEDISQSKKEEDIVNDASEQQISVANEVPMITKSADANKTENAIGSPPVKGKSWASLFSGSAPNQASKLPKTIATIKSEKTVMQSHAVNYKDSSQNRKKAGIAVNGSTLNSPHSTQLGTVSAIKGTSSCKI